MYEKGPCVEKQELSLGEQIFNFLDGYTPEEKRKALMEAHDRIHEMFKRELEEAHAKAKSIAEAWDSFKG